MEDPQTIHAAARFSSFVTKSAAANQYELPQAEVSHSDLLALSFLEPACRQLCLPLRNAATVGLRLPWSLAGTELFESWTKQKISATLQDDFKASIREATLSPRVRKPREADPPPLAPRPTHGSP